MSLGSKIADAMPDSVVQYIHDHPRVMYAVTLPMIAWATYNLMGAIRLHVCAKQMVGEMQKAASEALGG